MSNRRSLLAAAAFTPLLASTISGTQRAAAQAATPVGPPFEVEVDRDVVYGEADGQQLVLDVYRPPARDEPRPAIVQIHGGGWMFETADRTHPLATNPSQALAEEGYVVFNLDYRLTGAPAGANPWPAQLDDVQRAVRWVRSNADRYGVDPERVGAYGHSAGGHLAAMLGVRDARDTSDPELADYSSRVSAVVTIAGQMDLNLPYTANFDIQALDRLLGGSPDEVPEAYEDASPITWVDAESAPFLVIHGGPTDSISVDHARTMVAALQQAGVAVISVELPAHDHFSIAAWPVAGPWASTFFAMTLHPET